MKKVAGILFYPGVLLLSSCASIGAKKLNEYIYDKKAELVSIERQVDFIESSIVSLHAKAAGASNERYSCSEEKTDDRVTYELVCPKGIFRFKYATPFDSEIYDFAYSPSRGILISEREKRELARKHVPTVTAIFEDECEFLVQSKISGYGMNEGLSDYWDPGCTLVASRRFFKHIDEAKAACKFKTIPLDESKI